MDTSDQELQLRLRRGIELMLMHEHPLEANALRVQLPQLDAALKLYNATLVTLPKGLREYLALTLTPPISHQSQEDKDVRAATFNRALMYSLYRELNIPFEEIPK
jgi:hypothetical protein